MACGSCGGSAGLRRPSNNSISNNSVAINNQKNGKGVQNKAQVYNSSSNAPVVSFQRSTDITVKRTKV